MRKLEINPHEVVESSWHSWTEVGYRTLPLQSKAVFHDGLRHCDETLLFLEVANCSLVQDEHVASQIGFEVGKLMEIEDKVIV
jgi:hypothetical protein